MDVAVLKELIRSPVSAGTLDPTDLAAVAGMSPQGVPQGLGGGTNVQVSQDRDPATVVRVRVLVRRGRTWADGGPRPSATWWPSGRAQSRSATGSYVTFGDPGLDEDGQGTFSFAKPGSVEDDAAEPSAGVVVYRGGFYGSEFARDRPVLIQSPNYPNDSLDKEALVVDRRGGRTQNLYVSLTDFEETCNVPGGGFGIVEV